MEERAWVAGGGEPDVAYDRGGETLSKTDYGVCLCLLFFFRRACAEG